MTSGLERNVCRAGESGYDLLTKLLAWNPSEKCAALSGHPNRLSGAAAREESASFVEFFQTNAFLRKRRSRILGSVWNPCPASARLGFKNRTRSCPLRSATSLGFCGFSVFRLRKRRRLLGAHSFLTKAKRAQQSRAAKPKKPPLNQEAYGPLFFSP